MKNNGAISLLALVLLSHQSMSFTFDEPVLMHETDYTSEGTPTVVDWDGDGLVDVLFGERVPVQGSDTTKAFVSFWKNSGTAEEPSFAKEGTIQSDGEELCVGVG